MIAVRCRKYRGAHILIINEFQSFLAIIFYKGRFYQTKLDAIKQGKKEYTASEYATACDTMFKEACLLVDAIKVKLNIITKIKQLIYGTHRKLRFSLSEKGSNGQNGKAGSNERRRNEHASIS